MISGEFSFDLDEKSVENFKKAINYDEIEARHKRFMNGTETIDDLINGILHYRIKNDDDLDLDVVEFKYYQELINLYKKEKEKNKKIENELEKHIKFCEQEAKGHLNNEVCHISLKFNKKLLNILKGEE